MSTQSGYFEVTLEVTAGADKQYVVDWAKERGLTAAPMVVGVVVGGEVPTIQEAFGEAPGEVRPGESLQIPEELHDRVSAAHVVQPRHLHLPTTR